MSSMISAEAVKAAPHRPLATFRLPPLLLSKLTTKGFLTLQDVASMRATDISKEIDCTPKEGLEILRTIALDLDLVSSSSSTNNGDESRINPAIIQIQPSELTKKTVHMGQSAFDLLQLEALQTPIVTFCSDIDEMLGGGVQIGQITEFCGEPGIGKTQLGTPFCHSSVDGFKGQVGIQLAANVHIPDVFGGANGHSIYIDTEGSFMAERVLEIVEHVVEHINKFAAVKETQEPGQVYPRMSTQKVVENIFYYRVHDFIEQIALNNLLPTFLDAHPDIRVIVIDSITYHFRHDFNNDMGRRTRLLQNIGNQLMAMAAKYNLAVVLMNQVTTKLTNDRAHLVPALGESWSHVATNRINLLWKNGVRYASLVKSPANANKSVPFAILPDGIRSFTTAPPSEHQDSSEALKQGSS